MHSLHNQWKAPRVVWHEGMLLTPQHFQAFEEQINQHFNHQLMITAPYAWGIYRLEVDTLAISSGLIRIVMLQAVLPNGKFISFPQNASQQKAVELDLSKLQIEDTSAEITVCITFKKGVSTPLSDQLKKGLVEHTTLTDTYDSTSQVEILTAIDDFILEATLAPAPSHDSSLVLMKLIKEDAFKLTPYIPPCIYISHDMQVWQSCKQLAMMLRSKAMHLCGLWQHHRGTTISAETEHLLRPVLMALPKLEAMLNTSYISPYQLHEALVELISNLSPLYLSRPPLFMKGYNHQDIFSTLSPLIDEAQFYIDCIEQTYSIFPFQQKDKLFYLYLSSHKMQTTLYVGCVMAKGQTEDMVETWMMDAIIASDFAVDSVRAKRIRGARRKRIDAQTQLEMLPGRSVIVFEVPFDREYIALDQNINIFNPNDSAEFRPASLVLHIKKAQTFEPFALAG